MSTERERGTRFVASATLSGLVLCLVSAAVVANGGPPVVVVPIALIVAALATRWLAPRIPSGVVEAAAPPTSPSRWRVVLFWMLAAFALLETARLAAHMTHRPGPDTYGWTHSKFMRNHSCGTSYYEGALNVTRVENVYDAELYRPSNDRSREVEGFRPDPYQYPPAFLLLAAPIARVVPSYVAFRGIWFAFIGSVVLVAFWRLSAWVGGATGGLLAWVSLALWLTIPVQMTLQMGNFQLGVIALAVLGMIAIRNGRVAVGAAVLGVATAAKIFPGILLLYLLIRKEYRALVIAALSGAAFVALSALVFGLRPLVWFFTYQLPRLDSGEALPGLVVQGPIAINASIPGLVVKLQLIGVFLSRSYLSVAGWLLSGVILALTIRAGRRPMPRAHEAAVWLALIGLAAMRSPFLPHEYGTFPAIWIATILLAASQSKKAVVLYAFALLAFDLYLPNDAPVPLAVLAVAAGLGQATAIGIFAWVLLSRNHASVDQPRRGSLHRGER
jgi:hypothetical protein